MSCLFSADLALNLFVIVSQIDVVYPVLCAIGRNGIITFPVGCAERDWVRSKVFTKKLVYYTGIFSENKINHYSLSNFNAFLWSKV